MRIVVRTGMVMMLRVGKYLCNVIDSAGASSAGIVLLATGNAACVAFVLYNQVD